MSWRFTGPPRASRSRNSPILLPTATSTSWKGKGWCDRNLHRSSFPHDWFRSFCLRSLCLPGGQWSVHQASAFDSDLLRRVAIGELSCLRRPGAGAGFSFRTGKPDRPGDQACPAGSVQLALVCARPWPLAVEGIEWSRWKPAGRGQRAWPGGGVCSARRGETSILTLPPHQSREWTKASGRTRFSSTSLAVRFALIPGSASTRWSLPMHILPARASRRDFSPVVCGPLPCPCRQNLEPRRVFAVPEQPSAGVRVSTSEVDTQEIHHEEPTLPFSDQWSFGYWTHPWLGCRFCAAG